MNLEKLYFKVTEQFNRSHHIAHDIKHATRTAALAKYIATQEGYDPVEAEIAGLLHDMGRTVQKEEKGHGPAGVPLSRELLDEFTNYDDATKERILSAIAHHSDFRTEGMLNHIIQDADRLDGIGAVGLMRAYTSKAELTDYDPDDIIPSAPGARRTIHEQLAFQMEWLDMMNTPTGKRVAKKRHAFMIRFLEEFKDEVELKDLDNANRD